MKWVKKCMYYKIEGINHRDEPKRTCMEVVETDMKNLKIKKENNLIHW